MASTHERAALRTRLARRTRYLRRHLRLVLSVLLGIVAYLVLPRTTGAGTRLLAAFDLAAVAFLGAVWIMMARATTADMRRRSQIEDESRYVVLALSAAAALAILLAIASELHDIRNQPPAATGLRVTLAAVTILLAWFFMNTIFALHYALRPFLLRRLRCRGCRGARPRLPGPRGAGLLGLPLLLLRHRHDIPGLRRADRAPAPPPDRPRP